MARYSQPELRVRQYKGDGAYQRGVNRMTREGWTVVSVTTTASRRPIGLLLGVVMYWLLPKKTVYHVTLTRAQQQQPIQVSVTRSTSARDRLPFPDDAASNPPSRWWQRVGTIAWAMILLPPFGLVLMWAYAPWRAKTKLFWTFAYAVVTVGVVALSGSPAEDTNGDAPLARVGSPEARSTSTLSVPTPGVGDRRPFKELPTTCQSLLGEVGRTGEGWYGIEDRCDSRGLTVDAVRAFYSDDPDFIAYRARAESLARQVPPSPSAPSPEPATPFPTPTPRPTPTPMLALLSASCSSRYGFNTCEGAVKNLSDRRLSNVEVVILWSDANGVTQSSDEALIAYNPLLPGQESPWEVVGTTNPALNRYRVQFKELLGGTISTRDDRPR